MAVQGALCQNGAVNRWLHNNISGNWLRVMAVALLAALSVVPPC